MTPIRVIANVAVVERLKIFVGGIVYVGMGLPLRPYEHFVTASNGATSGDSQIARRLRQMGGHASVFQTACSMSVTQVAISESALIDAFGLANLENKIRSESLDVG